MTPNPDESGLTREQLSDLSYELDGVLADTSNGGKFDGVCRETVTRVRDALCSAPRAGFVEVPVEPTEEMVLAAWVNTDFTKYQLRKAYKAMLAASAPADDNIDMPFSGSMERKI